MANSHPPSMAKKPRAIGSVLVIGGCGLPGLSPHPPLDRYPSRNLHIRHRRQDKQGASTECHIPRAGTSAPSRQSPRHSARSAQPRSSFHTASPFAFERLRPALPRERQRCGHERPCFARAEAARHRLPVQRVSSFITVRAISSWRPTNCSSSASPLGGPSTPTARPAARTPCWRQIARRRRRGRGGGERRCSRVRSACLAKGDPCLDQAHDRRGRRGEIIATR